MILILLSIGAIFASRRTSEPKIEEVLSAEATPKPEEVLPVLEIFEGKVEINSEEAINGQKVEVGSVITTGKDGRAQLVYPNNSVVRIDFSSEMTLEEFDDNPQKSSVLINAGRIWSRVAKLLGKDDVFETKTETLVASVRGTSFGHGVLADGSNKISVSRSQVHVDCNAADFSADVTVNKKVTTKCVNKLALANWGGEEASDEWFNWNLDQDKKLDERFGAGVYDDAQPTPSRTPKPTVKGTTAPTPTSTVIPTATTSPTLSPTPTPTPTLTSKPTSSPTTRPTPTPTFKTLPPTIYQPGNPQIYLPTPTPPVIL